MVAVDRIAQCLPCAFPGPLHPLGAILLDGRRRIRGGEVHGSSHSFQDGDDPFSHGHTIARRDAGKAITHQNRAQGQAIGSTALASDSIALVALGGAGAGGDAGGLLGGVAP